MSTGNNMTAYERRAWANRLDREQRYNNNAGVETWSNRGKPKAEDDHDSDGDPRECRANEHDILEDFEADNLYKDEDGNWCYRS